MRAFFRQQVRVFALVAAAAFVARCAYPAPPPRTLEGLATMLGRATGATVHPRDIVWEQGRSFVLEALSGRSVLFLAAPDPGSPRDLYRAKVRLSLDGKPISVNGAYNLTRTSLGDDSGLQAKDRRAVVATTAFGRIQGISIFEVDGIRPEDRPDSWVDRTLLSFTALRRTGSFTGVGRTDVVFDVPAREARLSLRGGALSIDLGDPQRDVRVDLERRVARGSEGGQAYAARVVPHVQRDKPLILWLVDAVREEVGPTPIAWLEQSVFGARDTVKRTAFHLFADAELKDTSSDRKLRMTAARAKPVEKSWPPAPIPSLWKEPNPGEGEWQPVSYPWLPRPADAVGKSPPYFYTTFIRPDAERPYSEVWLVAMDMRQLELGMEGGYEDPQPLTGPPGTGRLPRERHVLDRVVATFNGAFKTTHGEYGMMLRRRVLIPPAPGGATIVLTHEGEVGFGTWPRDKQLPGDVVSFRQNLDPLVDGGRVNPSGRHVWGWHIAGQSVMTERTALCLTRARHVLYAWGREISGPGLAQALHQAGCDYAVHLDMNPKHCGFVFTDIADIERRDMQLALGHPDMTIRPDKFVLWSEKDFFYVMLRPPRAQRAAPAAEKAERRWTASPATQPEPAWLPGIYEATTSVGGLEVRLLSFEKGRFDWMVRAGALEPNTIGNPPKKTGLGDEAGRVGAAIGAGHTTEATRFGIAFDGKPSLDLRQSYATLVLTPGAPPRIAPPGEPPKLAPQDEAVQVPLLADDGESVAEAPGPMRLRSALCIDPSGRVLVGIARHDSSRPIVSALLAEGCQRVVGLDRGSGHPAFIHLAGTATPPLGGYETSTLYALTRPMSPHAFRWRPEG